MSNPNIILIHGNGGASIDDIWFPKVKDELEALGLEVVAQTMPDNIVARSFKWLPFMENELGADENSIIIGHSSGAVAAMRYAETHRIFGSVLVGASLTDLGVRLERMSGYFDKPWNWNVIKVNQNWIVQFASPDDPYIPIDEPRYIHDKLDTDYHEIPSRGHFMDSDLPEVVAVVKERLGL